MYYLENMTTSEDDIHETVKSDVRVNILISLEDGLKSSRYEHKEDNFTRIYRYLIQQGYGYYLRALI